MEIRHGKKRSRIKVLLKKKIEDWLESIEDKSVRKMAAENTIITGGSIASMLLGEKVNDYDIYFRDSDTAKEVAKYYVNKFNKANPSQKRDKIHYVPQVIVDNIENIKGEVEERILIFMKSAGVAAESQEAYDYFEMRDSEVTEEFANSLIEELNEDGEKYRPVFLSANAITLSHKIQLVTRFYGEPNEIHSNYDFVHAMCYYDYHNNNLVLPAEALEALLSRTLIYKGSLYPIASVFRTKKFIERGWRISAGQQLKMMWQISELDLTDQGVFNEQLTGVDAAYMYQLISALRGVDPEKINSAYVSAIIDKIFN